jgi:hypothetical protein
MANKLIAADALIYALRLGEVIGSGAAYVNPVIVSTKTSAKLKSASFII